MGHELWLWIAFNLFVIAMLALDLGVFHRRAHVIELKEALGWSAFWIVLAVLFNIGVYFWFGRVSALEFLTGYLIEKSLSMDNVFVFALIFTYFRVPALYQHKVLFWGILGALIMRFLFILAGVTLIQKFHWMIYVFGALLIVTGVRMAREKEKEIHPERNPVLRLARRLVPITRRYVDGRFFIRRMKRTFATPLFVVLIVVETTDLVFAVDSIPAILAITHDPFIVYTSNVFAILGLRALYFALAGLMRIFHYLHYGLSIILVFVGVKMLISDLYKIPIGIALGVVATVLTVSVLLSIWRPAKAVPAVAADPPETISEEATQPYTSSPEKSVR
ncbi:MAG: TerC family protein [Blastocatellia bacterium]|nr:TerC family protein [Blastocatellia bacterium]MCS7156314.1 TerC family protein [Blastocatellia bacterium]MCX7751336.1 TerC family protein [Blastocatellia bacterium]MDW8169048.1 TerC family protein [Acidobacteriota bacterium]MDW8256408.1 TerC family protein [Acidobacteriota bacterium]